jgi:GTPase involved in cell partitioning and DNA repair
VLSKSELIDSEQRLEIKTKLEEVLQQKVLLISAATANGLANLLQAVWQELGIEDL